MNDITPPIGYGYTRVPRHGPSTERWCHHDNVWAKDSMDGQHERHCCVPSPQPLFYRAPFVPPSGRVVVALTHNESVERGDRLHFDDGYSCEADASIGERIIKVFSNTCTLVRALVAVTRAIQTKPEVKLAPFGVWTAFSKRAPLLAEFPVLASHANYGAGLFKELVPNWGTFWKFWMRVEIPKLPDPADEAFDKVPKGVNNNREWFKLGWAAAKAEGVAQ